MYLSLLGTVIMLIPCMISQMFVEQGELKTALTINNVMGIIVILVSFSCVVFSYMKVSRKAARRLSRQTKEVPEEDITPRRLFLKDDVVKFRLQSSFLAHSSFLASYHGNSFSVIEDERTEEWLGAAWVTDIPPTINPGRLIMYNRDGIPKDTRRARVQHHSGIGSTEIEIEDLEDHQKQIIEKHNIVGVLVDSSFLELVIKEKS